MVVSRHKHQAPGSRKQEVVVGGGVLVIAGYEKSK